VAISAWSPEFPTFNAQTFYMIDLDWLISKTTEIEKLSSANNGPVYQTICESLLLKGAGARREEKKQGGRKKKGVLVTKNKLQPSGTSKIFYLLPSFNPSLYSILPYLKE
jgi:hypothetical protein